MDTEKAFKKDSTSRSWFCTLNNPAKYGFSEEPNFAVEEFKEKWIMENPQRSCAVIYCVSAEGLHHIHAVLESPQPIRFSTVKKAYPKMDIAETKGSKEQAEAYINKKGKWEEKGESILASTRHGEIKGKQGQRRDLENIEDLILQGKTPNEIMDMNIAHRKHEKLIRDAYYRKRWLETPTKRTIELTWHWGESGTGKTHTYEKLSKAYGEENVYLIDEYKFPFDKYNGEDTIFIDEFRGQINFEQFLKMFNGLKSQLHARYSNACALWSEAHITTVFPPEVLYKTWVGLREEFDSYEQLRRRITNVIYHYKNAGGEYCTHKMPMSDYVDYNHQKSIALNDDMILLPESISMPF